MGGIHKYECENCNHRWQAWELGLSSWSCPMCDSTDLNDLGEIDEDEQFTEAHTEVE